MTARRQNLAATARRVGKHVIRMLRPDPRVALLRMLPRGSIGAEVGVWAGDFSAAILKEVRPTRLHLIDPWRFEPGLPDAWYGGSLVGSQEQMDQIHARVVARFGSQIREGTVQVHRSSSSDAASSFEPHYFDWVYIDGNHLYEFVKQDLEDYWPAVKPGGLLTGDDYSDPGWWEDGVRRAVDEFAAARPCDKSVVGGQFVLRKQPAAGGQKGRAPS